MAWKDLTPRERITAASFDIMRDPEFSLLGGATQVGKVTIVDGMPTAGTDGRDVMYGKEFVMRLSRGQVRFVVAHETLHKMLMHCVEYVPICKKYPQASNMAMDYVVNLMIHEMDAGRKFIEWTTDPEPLLDAKYKDKSFLEVLQDLLKNPPPQGGSGGKRPLDEHTQTTADKGQPGTAQDGSGDPTEASITPEEMGQLRKDMQDAISQGQIVRDKLQAKQRGSSGSGGRVSGFTERRTDWKSPLKRFIQDLAEGDDCSRFSPPNKRMLPLGIVLPSHFTEAVGEIIIACDTSGSMTQSYPVIFGEVARICQQVKPAKVRMLWWDTKIAGDQTFTAKDYDQIAKQLKPAGGGGTTVSVVSQYIKAQKIKAQCVIMLTDGYIESQYTLAPVPHLWGIVDHAAWQPRKGKKIDINSLSL